MIRSNLSSDQLIRTALDCGEAKLTDSGALAVETKRRGRSPNDKFIVHDNYTDQAVDWGDINKPFDGEDFDKLWLKCELHLSHKDYFESRFSIGSEVQSKLYVIAKTEFAWHHLFLKNLFIQCDQTRSTQDWCLMSTPTLFTNPDTDATNSDGAVIINFTQKKVLITGISYAGEMKKAMFTIMNQLLPEKNILPMHCSSVRDSNGRANILFGLSGTGKTTLSSDPAFEIIGDDEAGWTPNDVVFNMEGGCYAKCINLSETTEPLIYNSIKKGCVLENVVLNGSVPDYNDDSLTQNSRAAYPLEHIANRVDSNKASKVANVIFLSCDLYGVLPPVALLNEQQAINYFLSGYTAKVGSTELGSTSTISPTFSPCFGAPFFPRPFQQYAELLRQRIQETQAKVYLVNTGYYGSPLSDGAQRYSIPFTRSIVSGIINNEFDQSNYEKLEPFGLFIPTAHATIDKSWFNPKNQWKCKKQYDERSRLLMQAFQDHLDSISCYDPGDVLWA